MLASNCCRRRRHIASPRDTLFIIVLLVLSSYVMQIKCAIFTAAHAASIFANADGPRDSASRKINHIALPTEYYQATSDGR